MQAVLKMLSEIGSVENIPEFIEGVKNRYFASNWLLLNFFFGGQTGLHPTGVVTSEVTFF